MPQCVVYTNDHRQCHNRGVVNPEGSPHLLMCRRHRTQHDNYVRGGAGVHPAGVCLHEVRHNRGPRRYTWCEAAAAEGSAYCQGHLDRHARLHHDLVAFRRVQEVWAAGGPAGFVAGRGWVMFDEDDLALQHALAGAGRAAPVVPELGRLARDNQNVHTDVVNRATEDGIARLCAVHVPEGQDTLRLVLYAISGCADVSYERICAVWHDIVHWWNTVRCRVPAHAPPDELYKRVLRGLVAHIDRVESVETRAELYRRLFQEAEESVGMCCDGHLSRLINVLVGFDDAFAPPVSQGELIQNRIAAIAAHSEASAEERIRLANAFFDEIAYPVPDRAAWLDVLAE
jgi:hypothetical protein